MIYRFIVAIFFITFFSLVPAAPVYATSLSIAGVSIQKPVKSLKEFRRQSVVTQSLDFSCGAAGLSTLLNYFLNDPVSETEIISAMLQLVSLEKVKARNGFSLYDLKLYAEAQGYKVTGYRMDFDFLKELGKPVLVPIKFKNYRHFVVVKGVVGDRVFLADPAMGNTIVRKEKFMSMWSHGVAFLVEHASGPENKDYALNIQEVDLRIANHLTLGQISNINRIRTTIFINEWRP